MGGKRRRWGEERISLGEERIRLRGKRSRLGVERSRLGGERSRLGGGERCRLGGERSRLRIIDFDFLHKQTPSHRGGRFNDAGAWSRRKPAKVPDLIVCQGTDND